MQNWKIFFYEYFFKDLKKLSKAWMCQRAEVFIEILFVYCRTIFRSDRHRDEITRLIDIDKISLTKYRWYASRIFQIGSGELSFRILYCAPEMKYYFSPLARGKFDIPRHLRRSRTPLHHVYGDRDAET